MLAVLRVRAWGSVCHVPLVESARFAVRNNELCGAGSERSVDPQPRPVLSVVLQGLPVRGAWVVWPGRSSPCCCAALALPAATTQQHDRTPAPRRNEEP